MQELGSSMQALQVQQMMRNGGMQNSNLHSYQPQPQLGSSTGTGAFFPQVPSARPEAIPTYAPPNNPLAQYGSSNSISSLQNQVWPFQKEGFVAICL